MKLVFVMKYELPVSVHAESDKNTDIKRIANFFIYRIVLNRRALPNRCPPPFLDVKQSMKIDLSSEAKLQQNRCYNY